MQEYEIIMAMGFDAGVESIREQEEMASQFLRNRFYAKDTYVVVDSISYQHLFASASQGEFTKMLIKSPPYLHSLERLIQSKNLKLSDAEARKVQLNLCLTIPAHCAFIPQFVQKLVQLNSHFGRIHHLVLDCRIHTFAQVLDLFTAAQVPCPLAYEVEFVLNVRQAEVQQQNINLKAIYKLGQLLAQRVSLDLTVLNVPINYITNMLSDTQDLNSLAVKFKGAYRQDVNLYNAFMA